MNGRKILQCYVRKMKNEGKDKKQIGMLRIWNGKVGMLI